MLLRRKSVFQGYLSFSKVSDYFQLRFMSGLKNVLLGLGNPLLDISANVDQAFLDKYEIKMNDQILAEEKHVPMFEELSAKSDVAYIAGGATQNSIRVAQWMLQVQGATSYIGCVGQDKYADKMKEVAESSGVNVQYMIDSSTATGTCGCCIMAGERSLVANLAAANNYKIDHVQEAENWKLVEDASVFYMAGFFITVSIETIMAVAEHACQNDKILCMNISAPFIMQVPIFKERFMQALPYMDYLFGNETEAVAFAEAQGWETKDISEIVLKIARMPKQNGYRCRTVVITQGAEATIVAQNGKVERFPVVPLAKDLLVDTNGAGDAFVGGFLSQLVVGKSVGEACRAGNYAATVVIQRSGCTYPDQPNFRWN
eukprot:TRINITY_DN2595_c0_g1_i1.p1 TRINITY_DN2595_c0_g1~~TRINITY_DN2595_c0_g1_i1.p1  ORF type:complete len:373 (+),score=83.12 TRINITY_DN2595_c0_g1_i1:39-1157(+)